MKRLALLFLFALCSVPAFAQRHIAFGYTYQPNERDHGGWIEGGFDIGSRLQIPITYTRFNDKNYFAELGAGLRLRLYEHVWVEGAYALGRYAKTPLRSYSAGLVLETPKVGKHFNGIARFDFSAEKPAGLRQFNRFRPYF